MQNDKPLPPAKPEREPAVPSAGTAGRPSQHDLIWHCRFHPTDWFHEVGCPHVEWTHEQLQAAIESQKKGQITLYEMWHADMERRYGCLSRVLASLKTLLPRVPIIMCRDWDREEAEAAIREAEGVPADAPEAKT